MTNSNFVGCSTGRCAGVAPPMRKSESQGSFTGERWRRLSCKLAEGEGFEPPRGLRPGGFQVLGKGRTIENYRTPRVTKSGFSVHLPLSDFLFVTVGA